MNESEYILVGNLTKVWAAVRILRDMSVERDSAEWAKRADAIITLDGLAESFLVQVREQMGRGS